MDRHGSSAATPDVSAQPILAAAAMPRRRLAGEDVQRACTAAQAVVAVAFGQSAFQPGNSEPSRLPARTAAFARQIAMYLAHIGFGVSMAEIGRVFGRDRTTVVHACHVIEDRRDELRFDDLLDHLEQAATALGAATRINRQG